MADVLSLMAKGVVEDEAPVVHRAFVPVFEGDRTRLIKQGRIDGLEGSGSLIECCIDQRDESVGILPVRAKVSRTILGYLLPSQPLNREPAQRGGAMMDERGD